MARPVDDKYVCYNYYYNNYHRRTMLSSAAIRKMTVRRMAKTDGEQIGARQSDSNCQAAPRKACWTPPGLMSPLALLGPHANVRFRRMSGNSRLDEWVRFRPQTAQREFGRSHRALIKILVVPRGGVSYLSIFKYLPGWLGTKSFHMFVRHSAACAQPDQERSF
jgi:hypothetical protein